MSIIEIPDGYQQIMPYLILQDANAFFAFMEKVFGATEKLKVMRDEATIQHAELQIGESTIMFADSTEQFKTQPAGMFVFVANADETYQKALSEGATSVMEMSDETYGRTGGIADPFGNVWWITSPAKQ